MRRGFAAALLGVVAALGILAAPAAATHDGDPDAAGMTKLFNSPNSSVPQAINSDIAFWGNKAYVGNYGGARIFDISNPASPNMLSDFKCNGPQNDPAIWKNLLFLAVDRTQTGPNCGSVDTFHSDGTTRFDDDPNGWEGVRIIDVSNPSAPTQVGSVYTDCGAHTITLWPRSANVILLYVSSYPLRPGPTCGPVRGPENGNSPLHEKISVIRVPVNNPSAARVIAQPKISYPGDPDNTFDPDEHGFHGFNDLTACHDIAVFVELRLAGAACAEQAQLWRVKRNGIPDTTHPLWVYDDNKDTDGPGSPGTSGDVAVDFWHSATFSWDGKIVNFIDESFGEGCPTVTEKYFTGPADTGRMFFLDTKSGSKLSHFNISRPNEHGLVDPHNRVYCSAHLGNTVPSAESKLLVNAWYTGGADVIDFNNPRHPFEATFYDAGPGAALGSDNWSAYWYEGPSLTEPSLTLYGNDGVEDPPTGEGFQVLSALTDIGESPLARLNPQTQEHAIGDPVSGLTRKKARRFRSAGKGSARSARNSRAARRTARHLAP